MSHEGIWGTFLTVLQSLPEGGQSAIQDLLGTVSTVEAAAIGGGGVASVGVVRWLVKRAAGGGSASQPTSTSVSTTTTAGGGGGQKSKVAFTLPGLIPLSKGIRSFTHNEIHALELGLFVGLAASWLYSEGVREPVIGIVVVFVAGALGFKRYSSKAFKTVRKEPWYGLVALGGGGGLGWWLFIADPGLLTILGVT